MARPTVLVLGILSFALLAGCSKAPPSGTLAVGEPALTLDGTSDLKYTAFSSGGNPTGVIPTAGNTTQCAQDQSPTPPPGGLVTKCTQASTVVHAHFMALPAPGTEVYELFLAQGTTATKEMDVGQVVVDTNNMWDLNKTYPQDLEKHFQSVELRLGPFVVAVAPAAQSGSEKFAVPKDLAAIEAKGTYKGKVLSVDVSGLPGNGTFVGRLYTQDAKTCLLSVKETFPLHNGANSFTATSLNIAQYAQFHIHVNDSLINLYKANVSSTAPACKAAS
jgi:hypothetical protein